MRRRPEIADARAAWWTWRAVRDVRAQLRAGAVRDVRVPAPPAVPERAGRAVRLILRRESPSCFERSLVLQRWLAAQGQPVDLIVGTEGGARGNFTAHAWLDGESQPDGHRYVEMLRLAP
ncbi:lasso peptide biosynthesis B2 protein [Solirubrobacter phytolaccae]|uniref:Lasso peptide biosynthesis B2 protein n=1 Tax=Solirubrobacter phytolaccae TaxID=1404360 RepID=A0A9X3S6G0_9ACTN|nr:lasso peptide biosynthesis B2 protein [Solirubrobacter phytolaccae]MDA0179869.1 lasso peptide biosynthesis B2 protein [Solirubrobacter phytolaccae]